jgi:hypothetical protein
MSRPADDFVTLHEVRISKMWGNSRGSYVYEGCPTLLKNGRPCALGKHKRRLLRRDPSSPLGPNAHRRDNHLCCADGEGKYMYCFSIEVNDVVILVNEENGTKLMGMSGEEFKKECDGDSAEVKDVCDKVKLGQWTITYARDDCNVFRAISVVAISQTRKTQGPSDLIVKQEDTSGDFSGELVISLKSFKIKSV